VILPSEPHVPLLQLGREARIDSRDFLAARRQAETELHIPAGPNPWEIIVIANGIHLLESIADRETGKERVGLAYVCDEPLETLR
jgi:hypothetical protein